MAQSRKAFSDKLYYYSGRVLKVVDGDTLDVEFDFGLNHLIRSKRVRMARYNTPEKNSEDPQEVKKAKDASAFFNSLVKVGDIVLIKTARDATEKYDRILGEVWNDPKGLSLNQQMLDSHHGLPWDGKGQKPV